jgi:hypothetical protein
MQKRSVPQSPAADSDEPYGLGLQLAAVALFVVAGLVLKNWLLNGYVGPLFVFFVLYLVPTGWRRLARIGRAR